MALVVATYPELGSAAQDNLIINILSVFAEFERELIRNRIAEVRAALKRQGKRVGGAVPYGYDGDPFTKQLVVNEEEARRVGEMFVMAAEGKRPSESARSGNERGWRPLPLEPMTMLVFRHESLMEFSRESFTFIAQGKRGKAP